MYPPIAARIAGQIIRGALSVSVSKERVVELLKSYPAMKRRIEFLRFELGNIPVIGTRELIESLALGVNPDGQGFHYGGHPSDKTLAIALQYEGIQMNMERDTRSEIRQELRLLEAEVARLEFYITLLDDREANVIKSLYFEQNTWAEVITNLHTSERSVSRRRKDAICKLAEMYSVSNATENSDTKGS